jgi:hypothetical protein
VVLFRDVVYGLNLPRQHDGTTSFPQIVPTAAAKKKGKKEEREKGYFLNKNAGIFVPPGTAAMRLGRPVPSR